MNRRRLSHRYLGPGPERDYLLTRRQLLHRGLALGAGLTAFGLLSACGDDEEEPGAGSAGDATPSGAATELGEIGEAVGAGDAGRVIIRTPGGSYEEAWRRASWEPFAEETGIQVVPIATNAARVLAMVEAGATDIDILDFGELQFILLQERDALEPLDLSKFSLTNVDDVDPVHEYYIANIAFATVMAYNTEEFSEGHPQDWAEFWDAETFPGARMLSDMVTGKLDLEFALMADGVPMDEIYPIDVDRAFEKLREIRSNITKWWDTGAVSAQMLADRQVVLGSAWNGRVQVLTEEGAPVDIEWNQGERLLQGFGVLNNAPNRDNAYRLIDYSLQPDVLANFATYIPYGPANEKAFDGIDDATAAMLPTSPENVEKTFANDPQWWVENADDISERWQEFLLE